MPDIYLWIEGKPEGPYTEDQVRQSILEGLIPNDLWAWHEGLKEWLKLASLIGTPSKLPSESLPPVPQDVSGDVLKASLPPIPQDASEDALKSLLPPIPQAANQGLWDDIKLHAGEVYKNGDASAGFKLLQEVLGIVSLLLLAAQLEMLLTGGRTSMAFNNAMARLFKSYMGMNSDQRRQVRAWVSLARTGFGIFNK